MDINQTPALSPIPSVLRIKELDIVRGFAIFGILFINVLFFSDMPNNYLILSTIWTGMTDQISYFGMRFLFEGKFYSLFSFLFGIGLAMQMDRSIDKGIKYKSFFTRRMLVLFIIGIAHAVLFFYGDILSIYAVLGLLIFIIFINKSLKTIFIFAIIFLVLPLGVTTVTGTLIQKTMEKVESGPQVREKQMERRESRILERKKMAEIYKTGSFTNAVPNNMKNYVRSLPAYLFNFGGYFILSMFLLGFYAGKKKLYEKIDEIIPKLKKWYPILFVAGVICNVAFLWAMIIPGTSQNIFYLMEISAVGHIIGVPALCFFYLITIILLLRNKIFSKFLTALGAVGKMALTSYILQSVLFGLIFYGYGLGLYTKVSPAYCILLAIAVFTIIIIFCNIWQKYFLFGPMEWLWRSLTYLKRQPFSKVPGSTYK